MAVERLTPGSLVEVNDVVTGAGARKLGLVDQTGVGYFDTHGDGALPKPLHAELLPRGLGTLSSLIESLPEETGQQMTDAWEYLTNKDYDVLTIARALYWGVANGATDPELLERMGVAATAQVKNGNRVVADSLKV